MTNYYEIILLIFFPLGMAVFQKYFQEKQSKNHIAWSICCGKEIMNKRETEL